MVNDKIKIFFVFGYKQLHAIAWNEDERCEIDWKAGESIRTAKIRIFVCFEACRNGWKAGCRPLIGLDGCFLKGVYKGQLLTAVGVDGDGQVFPIC